LQLLELLAVMVPSEDLKIKQKSIESDEKFTVHTLVALLILISFDEF
jgi:hypothetical protein